ncbi:hypothetical protein [Burkholderia stabilis]|uniref:hypothetical protein n=1 Tax=Burkholderia stabilis TaxID=95485 RepID=UPI0015919366|nr:hypothetical protein [Burkholderia stabilis]
MKEETKLLGKRIVAVFQPQAWNNDRAIDIDGREHIDVTDRVLRLPLDRIHSLRDYRDSTDNLVDGSSAALKHVGPFTVRVADSVCGFFGEKQLSDITEDMLVSARQATLNVLQARTLSELDQLWSLLGDVPVTPDGQHLDAPFLHFVKGAETETVWRWFEAQNPQFIVGNVQQGVRLTDDVGQKLTETEYLFHVEGLGQEVWRVGSSEKSARDALWDALTHNERDRVVQIECIDERVPSPPEMHQRRQAPSGGYCEDCKWSARSGGGKCEGCLAAEQDCPDDGPCGRKVPGAKVVILPDGYNGHTIKFFADPVQVDGNRVKLRCAEPGKEYMIAWRDRTAVQAAVAAQGGSLPEVARRDDVFALRNALQEVLLTSKATNKAAQAAQEHAYAAYLASFTAEEKAYVVSTARLWQTEKAGTGFFQDVELDSFDAVVKNLGRVLVHSFVNAAEAKAALRSVIAPELPNGVDWTVSVEMSVTADSAGQAARFALDDLRDVTLEEITVDVTNLESGRIEAVSVKNATSRPRSPGM